MLPIRDNIPSRHAPMATWIIIGANVVIFVLQLSIPPARLEGIFYLFGIVPARYTHPEWAALVGFPVQDYWPFLTHMFLHGSVLHILMNMWMLWIFGDNVEDLMGSARFVTFYIACGVIAGIIHVSTNGSSTVPTIGASGAIAGVLAAYAFLFPLARIICLIPILFIPLFVELHAFFFMIIWFFMQFFSGTMALLSPESAQGIAWWAHIGGFLAGVALHRFFLIGKRPPRRRFPDEYE